MDKVKIIGITGYKNSGKDTLAEYFIDNGFYKISFADPLKQACKEIFSFSDDQLYNQNFKEREDIFWKHTPRELFQKIGTDLFRNTLPKICNNINDDIWIKSIERKIIKLHTEKNINKFIIPDIRFENEAEFVKNNNGTIILINRQILKKDNHESEQNIDKIKYDFKIENCSTLEDLYIDIENLRLI